VTLAKGADAAIEAMKQGAYDYLFKPLDLTQLTLVVGEAIEVSTLLWSADAHSFVPGPSKCFAR